MTGARSHDILILTFREAMNIIKTGGNSRFIPKQRQ